MRIRLADTNQFPDCPNASWQESFSCSFSSSFPARQKKENEEKMNVTPPDMHIKNIQPPNLRTGGRLKSVF
jgi:hypothetical protein